MKDYNEFISHLRTLISFESVCAQPLPNMPFGEQNFYALNFMLDLAKSFGFETINYDNYAGEIVCGNGQEIGIIGHLDVVPTGLGWQTPPFKLTLKDGFYYGRGLVDDKMPLLLILYILKELKESGKPINRKFRLFLGCNEETGWKDLDYLSQKTSLPEYGFSPDGNFPVCYAEKGITIVDFFLPPLKNFYGLTGGTAVNAVCDYAFVKATKEGINLGLIEKHNLKLKDDNTIESFGKSAHGSTPHLGKNALKPLFEYFLDMGENVKGALDYIFNDKAGISKLENEQGTVTFSPDIARQTEDGIMISCDCRIPAPLSHQDIIKVVDQFNIKYSATEKHPTMMVEKDGWFVKTLSRAYQTVTGTSCQPKSMGGSTFARAFKKGCAFGPDFCTYSTNIHDANERIKQEDLLKLYEIYKKTIFDLSNN